VADLQARRVTPREARERFEDQVTRQVKGMFREFEIYLRDKYGLVTVDELPADALARLVTERFNRQGSGLRPDDREPAHT